MLVLVNDCSVVGLVLYSLILWIVVDRMSLVVVVGVGRLFFSML